MPSKKNIIFDKTKDFISIIAPASSCLEASEKLKEACDILVNYGFKVQVDSHIFSSSNLPFFANVTSERNRIFRDALVAPEVKIIWAFRGGYGCSEFVFNCLDIKISEPKILIGYSDLTILHSLLNQHYNKLSIHGSVLSSLLPSVGQDIKHVLDILSGKDSIIELISINNNSDKVIRGKIIGGNLTVFTNLIGTKLHPKTKGKILFLEDVNEKSYQIHRSLMHLKNAGIFKDVKAVIFGDFTNSDEYTELTIKSFCMQHITDIVTYQAHGIGHGRINYPIIMNHSAKIMNKLLTFTSPFRLIENSAQ